jgi:hypothetical protein
MHPTRRVGRTFLAACSVVAALALTAPVQASAGPSSAACKGAKHKLAQDEKHGANPGIIKRDQARVRSACHKGH